MNTVLITAAGGNGTAIQIIDEPLTRIQYAKQGKALGIEMEPYGAEQAGFLVRNQSHFEMGGSEFCGNASRAAAVLFSNIKKRPDVTFTVSGFDGTVSANVQQQTDTTYHVVCEFPGMTVNATDIILTDGRAAHLVDLGGIVHVLLEEVFPEELYESTHRAITKELGLENREAVGVIWLTRTDDIVIIHPVVWVREVDTFFYEDSCGSGTIAAYAVTGITAITQPSGKTIVATNNESVVTLSSEMEVIR